jgi:hypothetical protein
VELQKRKGLCLHGQQSQVKWWRRVCRREHQQSNREEKQQEREEKQQEREEKQQEREEKQQEREEWAQLVQHQLTTNSSRL